MSETMLPADLSDPEVAFPASVLKLMPAWDDIPDEFTRPHGNEWTRIASEWFFRGIPDTAKWKPKKGIDTDTAHRHLAAILGSWEPKHEHKEAAVAYLMSQWFVSVKGWKS